MKKQAILYRMEIQDHICPFGLRAKDLLIRKGFAVEDRILTTRAEVDEIKEELQVKTTPQVFIDDKRIGGFDDLQKYFGKDKAKKSTSYFPVLALFTIALLMTLSLSFTKSLETIVMRFVGFSMVMLGLLKLQDKNAFANSFLGYDILARRFVPYAFIYPYLEVVGGILMIGQWLPLISAPIMTFIGGVGALSVFIAVYIKKRELKCACVGGNSNVPLGFVSFVENAVMFTTGIYLLISLIVKT